MPNPLIGTRRLNTGKPADDRPHATPPRPEAYVGDNNPYRGTNEHGVEPARPYDDPYTGDDAWEDTTSGVFEPEKAPLNPVPVEIVTRYARELRRFHVQRPRINAGTVSSLAGRNDARSSLTINNISASVIYIGNTESVADFTGFPVAAGGVLNLNTEDAVYAYCASDASVAVIEEFSVKE